MKTGQNWLSAMRKSRSRLCGKQGGSDRPRPAGFSLRQSTPQAALGSGQPRPISRLGRSGRPYRPCFPHRVAQALRAHPD
eukprot:scaffold43060_cov56-Phaeocystis_antarctica.AAC.1